MNVLTTTWRQLVRRRLWPVALLLVAALAAVPVLLAREATPVAPPAPGPAVTVKADADDTLATPVVEKVAPEDRSRRRRVLGARKDPFEPAPVKKPKTKKKTTAKAEQADTPSSPPGSGGTGAPVPVSPVSTTLVGPVAPAPVKKTYAKGSLIIRFGDATSQLTRMNLPKLAALPRDEDPLLVYTRLRDHGKKAVFLVDEALEPTGDGTCQPHPSNCETIELAKGETEFFDFVDPETGEITAQYELDLIDIK